MDAAVYTELTRPAAPHRYRFCVVSGYHDGQPHRQLWGPTSVGPVADPPHAIGADRAMTNLVPYVSEWTWPDWPGEASYRSLPDLSRPHARRPRPHDDGDAGHRDLAVPSQQALAS